MRTVVVFLTVAVATVACVSASNVWPMPVSFTQGSTSVGVSPASFKIVCSSPCPEPLPSAIERYRSIVFINNTATDPLMAAARRARQPVYGRKMTVPTGKEFTPSATLTTLTVSVKGNASLAVGVDESYTLDVTVSSASATATISAATQWGAMRGLDSFAQLVDWTPGGGAGEYAIMNASVSVSDKPRFAWRGLLIDSSRHYLHVDSILRTMNAMEANKMNVVHWHLADDESWPLESTTYPNFTKQGAYTQSAIYTHDDVKMIVEFGWQRGIMVLVEFDMPAHATVWGNAYPDLVISCPDGQTLLNPTGPVYDVVDGLLTEFGKLLPMPFMHIGGDEVKTLQCWNESSAVQAFATEHNLKDMNAVRSYFEGEVQAILARHNKRAIVWEEVFDGNYNVSMDTIVNVWLSAEETANVVKSGRQAIHSYGWYLDQQVPPGGTHYLWQDTYINFYLNEPVNSSLVTPKEAELVLGGEGSMWGEQVNDLDIDVRVWPRAAATAERLWSPKEERNVTTLGPRLRYQQCNLAQRGISAGPVRPPGAVGFCFLPNAL